MSCGGWASAHPPLSVVARGNLGEEREILTPVRVALLEGSGRTSAEPEVSGTGRLFPEIVAVEAGADPEVRTPLPSPLR